MKSVAELEKYYESDMLPQLEVLDARRKNIIKKWVRVGAFTLIAIALSCVVLSSLGFSDDSNYLIAISSIIILGVIVGVSYARDKTFYSDFKLQVIERIIKFVNPNLSYESNQYIPPAVFRNSRIFQYRIDRYRGDDLVMGMIEKTQIQFSEIHAEYKTTTTDSKGRKQTHWHTIFKGLFFMADFNKHFQTVTVVLPNNLGKGFLPDILKKIGNARREKLIKLEDPRFNKHFTVYGDDQVEARYVLSTSLMRRITEFKEKNSKNLYLSFVDSQLFMAIPYSKDLFEPKYLKKLTNFNVVREYFEDIQLAISIVAELNLNNRIWTKR